MTDTDEFAARTINEVPTSAQLRAIYRRLLAYPNVVGCFVGKKQVAGILQDRFSIVCCVSEKAPLHSLHPSERIPRFVRWRPTSGSRTSCPVDVQVLLDAGLHALAISGPGDMVTAFSWPDAPLQSVAGTLGVAIDHPEFGPVVTTAGHVFRIPPGTNQSFSPQIAPRVVLQNGDGANAGMQYTAVAVKVVLTPATDYALLKAVGTPTANVYRDSFPLRKPYAPEHFKEGTILQALTNRGLCELMYHGAEATLPLGGMLGERLHLAEMGQNLLFGGDSGCAIIDSQARVWGLHLGYVNLENRLYSVFRTVADTAGDLFPHVQ